MARELLRPSKYRTSPGNIRVGHGLQPQTRRSCASRSPLILLASHSRHVSNSLLGTSSRDEEDLRRFAAFTIGGLRCSACDYGLLISLGRFVDLRLQKTFSTPALLTSKESVPWRATRGCTRSVSTPWIAERNRQGFRSQSFPLIQFFRNRLILCSLDQGDIRDRMAVLQGRRDADRTESLIRFHDFSNGGTK